MLTYARHSGPLSSEGSLACHTYCDNASVYMHIGHLRGPVTPTPVVERSAEVCRDWVYQYPSDVSVCTLMFAHKGYLCAFQYLFYPTN